MMHQDLLQAMAPMIATAFAQAGGALVAGRGDVGNEGVRGGMRVCNGVVETVVIRIDRLGGTGFQDWNHRLGSCVGGCNERLLTVMTWAESQEGPIDASSSILEYDHVLKCPWSKWRGGMAEPQQTLLTQYTREKTPYR